MLKHLLMIVLGVVVLGACGSTAASTTTPTPEDTAGAEESVATAEHAPPIEIRDPWVRARIDPGSVYQSSGRIPWMDEGMYPVFLTVVNNTDSSDTLVSASSNVTDTLAFYEIEPVQQITTVDQVPVPAGDTVHIDQGPGYHLLMQGVDETLRIGDEVQLTLTFAQAGEVDVVATVMAPRQDRQQW